MFDLLALIALGWATSRVYRFFRRDGGTDEDVFRDLRGRRVTRIADAREGQVVRVVGRVRRAGAPLVAPFTGEPCWLYHAVVERLWPEGEGEVARSTGARDFYVEDESGRMLVHLRGARLLLAVDRVGRVPEGAALPAPIAAFVREHPHVEAGGRSGDPPDAGPVRYGLQLLREGDYVEAMGFVRSEPGGETDAPATYREAARRLALCATDDVRLVVSNHSPHVIRI